MSLSSTKVLRLSKNTGPNFLSLKPKKCNDKKCPKDLENKRLPLFYFANIQIHLNGKPVFDLKYLFLVKYNKKI
jgi:hypothetical protein